MDSRELSPMVVGNGAGGCDESKCVSKARTFLHGGSFTCYGDTYGAFFPMMCADGYLPSIVEDEPPSLMEYYGYNVSVSYFTCCPPEDKPSDDTDTSRHCSDPIPVEGNDDEAFGTVCENEEIRRYARPMKTSEGTVFTAFGIDPYKTESFVCCDSAEPNVDEGGENNATTRTSFLDDTECVPYRNEFYEFKKAENKVGLLRVVSCDFPEGDFVVPRAMGGGTIDDVALTGQYQCCKSGPALPPFIQDSAFNTTVYPPVILWSVTALVSAIVFTGLLTPLLIALKNGTYQSAHYGASSYSMRGKEPPYSAYNLYLVYLVFGDLIFALFQVGWYMMYINQNFDPNFHSILASPTNMYHVVLVIRAQDASLTYSYIFMNMWINAIIAYELLALLRRSKSIRRVNPIGLRRVNLQAGAVYFIAILYAATIEIIVATSRKAGAEGDFETVQALSISFQVLYFSMILLPMVFLIYFATRIWWGGFVPKAKGSNSRDKALRQLFFFFMRIVGVFFGIWIPSLMFTVLAVSSSKFYFNVVSWCLLALQPILSMWMILTKRDARKYILKLVTLSYLFGEKEKESKPFGSFGVSHNHTSLKDTSQPPVSGTSLAAAGKALDSECSCLSFGSYHKKRIESVSRTNPSQDDTNGDSTSAGVIAAADVDTTVDEGITESACVDLDASMEHVIEFGEDDNPASIDIFHPSVSFLDVDDHGNDANPNSSLGFRL